MLDQRFRLTDPPAELVHRQPDLTRPGLPPKVIPGGHGGSHPYIVEDWVRSILDGRIPEVNVYEAIAYCSPGRTAYVGLADLPENNASSTWDFAGQGEALETNPKVSLHESGACLAEVGGYRTGFVWGASLDHSIGGHVATVTAS